MDEPANSATLTPWGVRGARGRFTIGAPGSVRRRAAESDETDITECVRRRNATLNVNTAARRAARSEAFEAALVPLTAVFRWTPEVQLAFIATLAQTGRVDRAAAAVGTNYTTVYALRRRDQAFAAAWADALACHAEAAEALVLDHAVNGYEAATEIAPGRTRVKSERLMAEVLRGRRARAVGAAALQAGDTRGLPPGHVGEQVRLKIEAIMTRVITGGEAGE